jgi:hypothetical protein
MFDLATRESFPHFSGDLKKRTNNKQAARVLSVEEA